MVFLLLSLEVNQSLWNYNNVQCMARKVIERLYGVVEFGQILMESNQIKDTWEDANIIVEFRSYIENTTFLFYLKVRFEKYLYTP